MSLLDEIKVSHRYTTLPSGFFHHVLPTPLDKPRWVSWNQPLAERFGFSSDAPQSSELLGVLSGSLPTDKFKPLAMKYAGHQFGTYNPDLGDGRGLLLGELVADTGTVFDLHLKGSGQTPYSRMGDGRAVLRSTIREYLCSEAMAGLGVPTTRALGMMVSDTPVYREKVEQGALLLRLAESHIRFGHFEHFFYTEQHDLLRHLADKVIEWHFPQCQEANRPYLAMFERIIALTADMIAHWQSKGFTHGVMNTDNMSILGQTLDYGPFGFMDEYQPSYVCNHSDYQGRYAFDRQPSIALWNLTALAQALTPLIERADLEAALERFSPRLQSKYSAQMREKFGLNTKQPQDGTFFENSFALLESEGVDYPRFFRALSCLDIQGNGSLLDLFVDRNKAETWLKRYLRRCDKETISASERGKQMRTVNPKYILRNYLAQQAIEKAEQGDFALVNTLAKVLKTPFDEQPDYEHLAKRPPDWGKTMVISCSS